MRLQPRTNAIINPLDGSNSLLIKPKGLDEKAPTDWSGTCRCDFRFSRAVIFAFNSCISLALAAAAVSCTKGPAAAEGGAPAVRASEALDSVAVGESDGAASRTLNTIEVRPLLHPSLPRPLPRAACTVATNAHGSPCTARKACPSNSRRSHSTHSHTLSPRKSTLGQSK